jgi:hypothetical protein
MCSVKESPRGAFFRDHFATAAAFFGALVPGCQRLWISGRHQGTEKGGIHAGKSPPFFSELFSKNPVDNPALP